MNLLVHRIFSYLCALDMTDKELDERVARAVDNFMQGYGCC